jgi:hypothetical protein
LHNPLTLSPLAPGWCKIGDMRVLLAFSCLQVSDSFWLLWTVICLRSFLHIVTLVVVFVANALLLYHVGLLVLTNLCRPVVLIADGGR